MGSSQSDSNNNENNENNSQANQERQREMNTQNQSLINSIFANNSFLNIQEVSKYLLFYYILLIANEYYWSKKHIS